MGQIADRKRGRKSVITKSGISELGEVGVDELE